MYRIPTFCPFCTTNHSENLAISSLKLEAELASRIMTHPSGKFINHSLHKNFSRLLQFLPENLQHTQWRMNKLRLSAVNFNRKSWSKSFNNRIGSKCICATTSRQYTELFYKPFTRATESGRSMGGYNFRNFLPNKVPKCYAGKIKFTFFDKHFWKSSECYYLEHGLYFSITDIVESMNTLIQERQNHSEFCIIVKVFRRTWKVENYLANEGSGHAFF